MATDPTDPTDPADPTVLLGTVAIEPNRWATVDPSGDPTTMLSVWMDPIADAGFDGLEVWERHLTGVDADEADRVLGHELPVTVLNSYVSFDSASDAERSAVAEWVGRTGASGVKFNVGNDPDLISAYGERLAVWSEAMPDGVQLLCECHEGISVAEDPAVAARILDAGGPASRVQAIVHTHESDELTRARFDAYGDRITHVHVNHLDVPPSPPPLAEMQDQLAARVDLLRSLGFDGTWTIEFVHGTLSDDDHPEHLVAQAATDLHTLRQLLT